MESYFKTVLMNIEKWNFNQNNFKLKKSHYREQKHQFQL